MAASWGGAANGSCGRCSHREEAVKVLHLVHRGMPCVMPTKLSS